MKTFSTIPAAFRHVRLIWGTIRTNWVVDMVHKFVLIIFVLSLVTIAWKWRDLPPLVPLWYARPWGLEQLAHPLFLLILPGTMLTAAGVNMIIMVYFTADYLIFTQMLSITTLTVTLLSFFTLIKILFLVT